MNSMSEYIMNAEAEEYEHAHRVARPPESGRLPGRIRKYTQEFKTLKKSHQCQICGKRIEPGEVHSYETGEYYDMLRCIGFAIYAHTPCFESVSPRFPEERISEE